MGVFLTFAPALVIAAEHECRTDMEYIWMKLSDTGELSKDEVKVFWTVKKSMAETEELAKKRLHEMVQAEKTLAREACRKQHENLSGCIASKFQAMKAVLRQLDFTSRKTLEESVEKDCKAQSGVCKEVVVGDVKCLDMTPTDEDKKAEEKEEEKES